MLKRSWLWLRAHSHAFIVSALAILCVVLLGFLGTLSSTFQQCDGGRSAGYSQKEQPNFREKTGTIIVCEGMTIDANGGLLTALATIAVAAFTLTLWLTSRRQAEIMEGTLAQMKADAESRTIETVKQLNIATDTAQAAKKSADVAERTLTELEAPFLYPVIKRDTVQDQFRGFVLYDATPGWATPTVTFVVRNFGRTPALIRSVAAELDQLTEISAKPRDGILEDVVVDPVLEPERETEREFELAIVTKIDLETHKKIAAGQNMLWLYGKVLFSDMLGFEYTQHFSFVYLYGAKRFVPWRYNKRERH